MKTNVLRKLHKDSQGFTLIELMIVVAIIGILAAIAIPQFAQYRIRGFNTAAISDLKNTITGEATLSADWQQYGTSQANAGVFAAAAPLAGVRVNGGDANGDGIAATDRTGAPQGIGISLSNGVDLVADTNAVPAAALTASTFGVEAKHVQGDTGFAANADSVNIYQNKTAATYAPGIRLAVGISIAPTTNTDDYGTAAAVGAGWLIK